MTTNWNTTRKRYPYFRTKEQELGEENLTFSPSELADELTGLLRRAQAEGYYEAVRAIVKAALDSTNDEGPTPYASPLYPGGQGIPYEQAHEKPTPKMGDNEDYDSVRHSTSADNNSKALRTISTIFKGGDVKSKKSYDLFHHAGQPPFAMYPSAVRKIAKKLGISDQSGEGIIPTKSEATAESVARSHILRHLSEINK